MMLERSALLRKQYETNIFGLMDVTTAFLPYLRSSTSEPTLVVVGSRSAWKTELPVTITDNHHIQFLMHTSPGNW